METELRRRVRGALLGGAVGDALGAPVEGASLAEIRERFGAAGVSEFAPGRVRPGAITDDTQMTLFTAEGLVLAARGGVAGQRSALLRSVHRAYLRWLRGQGERSRHPTFERTDEGWLLGVDALRERRGPGRTCLSALRMERMGRVEQPLNTSKGCGGVMRIAPVGLALALDDPFRLGCEIAALTHGHPSGFLAAGLQASLIRELLLGSDLLSALREGLEELRRWPGHEECAERVERASAFARAGPATPETVESLGQGWVAEEALAIGVYCALAAPDFASGVRLAVNHGGDSDSTGAIAGNLLGAQLGADAIPAAWREEVELHREIETLADELHAALGAVGTRSGAREARR
jgi:ADP-ribosylglycohydrolase